MSKAKASAIKRARLKNGNAVGDFLTERLGAGAKSADYIGSLILEEGKRLQEKGAELTNEQRSMILVRMGNLAEKLAKLTGEGALINERKFLRSANGERFKGIVVAALRPFPDAARALGEALKAAEAG